MKRTVVYANVAMDESELNMSRAERKRAQEKRRRGDLKEAIDRLRIALMQPGLEDFRRRPERHKKKRYVEEEGSERGREGGDHALFSRINMTNQAADAVEWVMRENRQLKKAVEELQAKRATKQATAALDDEGIEKNTGKPTAEDLKDNNSKGKSYSSPHKGKTSPLLNHAMKNAPLSLKDREDTNRSTTFGQSSLLESTQLKNDYEETDS